MTHNDEFLTPFISEDEDAIPGIEEPEEETETPGIPTEEEDEEEPTME